MFTTLMLAFIGLALVMLALGFLAGYMYAAGDAEPPAPPQPKRDARGRFTKGE